MNLQILYPEDFVKIILTGYVNTSVNIIDLYDAFADDKILVLSGEID